MGYTEQRRYDRVVVDIYVHWGWTEECLYTDRILNISVGGCFLRTAREAAHGQRLFMRLWLPEEVTLAADVRYRLEKMGLGLEFVNVTGEQSRLLVNLVEHYRRQTAQGQSNSSRWTSGQPLRAGRTATPARRFLGLH